jgi:hypothetical protein
MSSWTPRFFVAAILTATPALGQIPAELVEAERAKILDGVESIPLTGSPGPVGIWGNLAFPLIAAAGGRDGNELALAAAAGYGKGRVILFGHGGYLNGNAGGDAARLMRNCVRWVGNQDNPSIGTKGLRNGGVYSQQGFDTQEITAALQPSNLKGFDVIIINAQGVTDPAEGAAIANWVKNGGGLIAGMTGWAYGQTSGGKELTTTHGLNQALLPAGVGFTEMTAFANLPGFQARIELPRMMNAYEAITAIKKQREGGPALSSEKVRQGANAIQVALAAQPPDRSNLKSAVTSALGGSTAAAIPTAEEPLTQEQHASTRLQLGMETRVLRLTSGPNVAAHPAAEHFPGQPPAEAPRVTKEVTIDPKVNGWHSTGLYAAAGDPITLILPTEHVDAGLSIRIGCHSDTLYHLDKWLRAPDITKSELITAAETRTASAFGGLIYIVVPTSASDHLPFTMTIAGGVEAPLFVLGQTTDEEWTTVIRQRPAPWAEFACGRVILSAPTAVARTVRNPTMLMQFWDKAIEVQDEISNQAADRTRPERIVADVQISAGYMHSGYPIMVPVSAAGEMVTFNRLKFPGWGFHHEVGHNHQKRWFTFDGTGEVTNNVLAMYAYEAALGKDWLIGHPQISPEARKEHIQTIKKATDKWQTWKSKPFVALVTYIQLVQAFGWESWSSYLHSFAGDQFGPTPTSDADARDQFLIRYSKIVDKNLGPFFDAWGIPVTENAKAEVANLETWMPTEM